MAPADELGVYGTASESHSWSLAVEGLFVLQLTKVPGRIGGKSIRNNFNPVLLSSVNYYDTRFRGVHC